MKKKYVGVDKARGGLVVTTHRNLLLSLFKIWGFLEVS